MSHSNFLLVFLCVIRVFFGTACSAGPYQQCCHLLQGGTGPFPMSTIGLENPLFIHLSLCNAAPVASA